MARVRNLKYENSIVEQPVHDGTPLIKWIHDGVVVWENGGGNLKDIIVSIFWNGIMFYDYKEKKILGTFISGLSFFGTSDKFVWGNNYRYFSDGTFIARTPDEATTGGGLKLTYTEYVSAIAKSALINCENVLITTDDNTNFYKVTIDADNLTCKEEYVGHIDLIPSDNTHITIIKGLNRLLIGGKFISERVPIVTSELINDYTHYKLFTIDGNGAIDEILSTSQQYSRPSYGTYITSVSKVFYANNCNYYFYGTETRDESGYSSKSYVLKIKDGKVSTNELPLYWEDASANVNAIQNIIYDSDKNQYLLYLSYYQSSALVSRILIADEDLNVTGEITLPEYMDIPYGDSSIRIWFRGTSYDSRNDVLGFSNMLPYTYYNEDGEIEDTKYLFVARNNQAREFVFFDNLYCNASEGNYAINVYN